MVGVKLVHRGGADLPESERSEPSPDLGRGIGDEGQCVSVIGLCPFGDFDEGPAVIVALDEPVHGPVSGLQIEVPSGTTSGPKRIEMLVELRSAITSSAKFLAQGLAMEREPSPEISDGWVPIIGHGPRPESLLDHVTGPSRRLHNKLAASTASAVSPLSFAIAASS